jgi:hypothetical protein
MRMPDVAVLAALRGGVEIRVGGEGDNALVLVESDLAAVEGCRPDVGVDVRASNLPVAAGFSQPASPRTQVVKIAVLSLVTMVVSMMSNGACTASFGSTLIDAPRRSSATAMPFRREARRLQVS